YTTYVWDPNPTLSNTNIRTPIATPVADPSTYYCTATEGFCNARDSVTLKWKKPLFFSKVDVVCKAATTGQITFYSGPGWMGPVMFSINNGPWQPTGFFSNLPVGSHRIKITDATGCLDSMDVTINQLFPDLLIDNIASTPATCSGNADGTITINASGGNAPFLYSIDGLNYQASNVFNVVSGNILARVKDNNNCVSSQNILVPLNNNVNLDAGADATICEGKNYQLNPNSNGNSFVWTPAATLSDPNIIDPVASPITTTKYFVTATTGICSRMDSITVLVDPAPIPDAGLNKKICFETDHRLSGSGGISFLWTPSTFLDDPTVSNPLVMQLTNPMTYYLSVIDANGCTSLQADSVTITVTAPPVLNIGPDTTIAIRQPLQLFARDVNGSGFDSWSWTPVYGLNDPFSGHPVAILDRDISYFVTASSVTGCLVHDTIKIKVYQGPELYVPNAFTPNGNALNDILKVIPIGMRAFHFFRIYNRYGQLVFLTTDPYSGWDGTFKGKLQTAGTYVWMAEAIDYRGNLIKANGTVILIQ
ncbi:MAG TPA: gliding motility-associated C-terminal domain-containing protein, partial [Ferruginibacter sp.]|nr:gliding motility-associated C-terminal domain-containing protein [Ferruginibacter sp.]